MPATRYLFEFILICILCVARCAVAGDAPAWMHAVVNVPVPAHDEKTDAVLLYSETNVTVISPDKIKTMVRRAYKILRPDGREYGVVVAHFRSPGQKINGMHGWCIPADGKDFEVKDKEAVEISLPRVEGAELISDIKDKLLTIPAADPGNIVGYEYEVEEDPLVLQSEWDFQEEAPAREARYSLQLPPGWEYKAAFINYPDSKPTQTGAGQYQWVVSNVKGLRPEEEMPSMSSLAGEMIVSLFPPGGANVKGFSNWHEMGIWEQNLESGRAVASPEIKQKVTELTADKPLVLDKMRVIASFVQSDIRYVAIELGIGGWQPHPASDVFTNRYGDCKDKATLMSAMLHELGVESFQVETNVERESIAPETPAYLGFDHQIIAIKLPEGLTDPSLVAVMQHPKLGQLLFFDPTNELTPFGQIGGYLQDSSALLVTPDGGELVRLPMQPSEMNGIRRTGKLTLSPNGTLTGDVEELRMGDRAWIQRARLRTATDDKDRVKPIEALLSASLPNFEITKASLFNLNQTNQPFGFRYSFATLDYAKNAGGLLLVRPRVLGSKSDSVLETKEARQFPIEFPGPVRDTDDFQITLPPGYEVDDLPPPVDADFGFAIYHSKTEVKGNTLDYTRSFEIKQLSVPVSKAQDLKKFYRIIAGDERNTAVLKPSK